MKILKLNKQYRKKNKPDRCAFFWGNRRRCSEIVICPGKWRKNGENFKKELTLVLIHGILHLFDTTMRRQEGSEKMFEKQEEYLSKNKFN
jgi:rRNA maturation RNase YbeY